MAEVDANLKLNLSADQVRDLVAEAIMARLDDTTRDGLIEQAIRHILAPVDTSYGSRVKRSPLEEAFQSAVQSLTYRLAHEYIAENPDVQERLRAVIIGGMEKMLTDDRQIRRQVGDWLGESIKQSFKDD